MEIRDQKGKLQYPYRTHQYMIAIARGDDSFRPIRYKYFYIYI